MKDSERKLILDLALGRISETELLRRYPVDPRREPQHVTRLLERAREEQNADDVEYALMLGFTFGFAPDASRVLAQLIVEPWHVKHEDIARALDKLKDPATVQSLYVAAITPFDYLSFDENHSLGVKCVRALGKIWSPEARERLEQLAKSDREPIREAALKQLHR